MSRDGVRAHDAVAFATQLVAMEGLRCTGICTHFATADDPHNPFMVEQLSTFRRVVEQCASAGCSFATVHAANSGALWQSSEAHLSLVRPGLSLYGYASAESAATSLRPVMRISSAVVSLRRVWPGDTVSYGRRYMVTEESTIATVPIGYGDGYMRALTGSAQCLIRGKRYPVVGTICMDEIMVNVGNDAIELGDEVVLCGTQHADQVGGAIDVDELAAWASTIPYEITTAVSARVPRLFKGALAGIAQGS
jgi:alanine racemase